MNPLPTIGPIGPGVARSTEATIPGTASSPVDGAGVDQIVLGQSGPTQRPQPPDAALPGTYDRWGRMADGNGAVDPTKIPGVDSDSPGGEGEASAGPALPKSSQHLSAEEQVLLQELRALDREVRAHEQAHTAVGGSLAGGASYTYKQGPDGQRYAVAGEVPISMPSASDPRERIAEAQQVRRAALAPAQPSGADRAIASAATQMELQARAELQAEALKEAQAASEESPAEADGSDSPEGGDPVSSV